jgi:glycosyltransferase involved in cell wall biosynthesis
VTVGSLVPAKDHATLLRAYAAARAQGLCQSLVIVGEGSERETLEHFAHDLGVAGSVRLVGHRDNPYPYMRHADFFVLSSIFEGFGLALLEAMSLGLACLSTDCPSGPGEILAAGQHGILVPPQNPRGLADAMLRLGGSADLRNTLSHQSRCRAQHFSLQRMAEQYRDLLLQHVPVSGRSVS